ncbi:ribulokinase, partial [Klebsiella pneumoniae]
MQNDTQNIIGVDVGSGSVRAGVFNLRGELLAHATREITLFRSAGNKVEQSSREIWQAVCYCIKTAVANAGVSPSSIAGIGFDATCSLVVIGDNDAPLAVGPSGDADRNIIVWMDHRATGQAEKINATGHPVLRYVGGKISPEMQTPKILWLKENRPHIYQQARHFFDLADYLTWRSTGDEARSVCTVTCKWTYLAHEQRWDAGYFRQIGLAELADEDFVRIGQRIVDPGTPCGDGLCATAAEEMGLPIGTPVAVG